MRSKVVTVLLAVMLVSLLGMLLTRVRTKHDAPAEEVAASPTDAGAPEAAPSSSAAASASGSARPPAPPPSGMRVVGLGWEWLVPAVTPAGDPGPDEIAAAYALDGVEARLAKGPSDPGGAEIALMPLASLVVSYDRLKALDARAFLVVGFSAGREELRAAQPSALLKGAGPEDVTLVAAPAAAGSEAATLLGLFALDAIGVPASRIKVLPATAPEAKAAAFAAALRGAEDDRKRVLSSADAPRAVPIVAVASGKALDADPSKYAAWARRWIEGAARARTDAATLARRLAAKEGARIAPDSGSPPEALALVERLGLFTPATLEDNGRLARAEGEASLAALLKDTWRVARAGGLVTGAPPEAPPLSLAVMKTVAPEADAGAPAPPASRDAGAEEGGAPDAGSLAGLSTAPSGSSPLMIARLPADADAEAAARAIERLAFAFDRATIVVSVRGGEKPTRDALARAVAHGVVASRLALGKPDAAATTIEIHAPR